MPLPRIANFTLPLPGTAQRAEPQPPEARSLLAMPPGPVAAVRDAPLPLARAAAWARSAAGDAWHMVRGTHDTWYLAMRAARVERQLERDWAMRGAADDRHRALARRAIDLFARLCARGDICERDELMLLQRCVDLHLRAFGAPDADPPARPSERMGLMCSRACSLYWQRGTQPNGRPVPGEVRLIDIARAGRMRALASAYGSPLAPSPGVIYLYIARQLAEIPPVRREDLSDEEIARLEAGASCESLFRLDLYLPELQEGFVETIKAIALQPLLQELRLPSAIADLACAYLASGCSAQDGNESAAHEVTYSRSGPAQGGEVTVRIRRDDPDDRRPRYAEHRHQGPGNYQHNVDSTNADGSLHRYIHQFNLPPYDAKDQEPPP